MAGARNASCVTYVVIVQCPNAKYESETLSVIQAQNFGHI